MNQGGMDNNSSSQLLKLHLIDLYLTTVSGTYLTIAYSSYAINLR